MEYFSHMIGIRILEISVADRRATLILPFNKNIQAEPANLNVTLWRKFCRCSMTCRR
jgi:hypothetical protein